MKKFLTASAGALALAGMTLGAAAPAEARYHGGGRHGGYYGGYHGYHGYHHGGGRTALALGAGVLGLAAGAAIANSHRGYGYGYGYAPAEYDYGPGYYAPPPPPDYYGGYCRSDWRWDGWARRYVRVRYCD